MNGISRPTTAPRSSTRARGHDRATVEVGPVGRAEQVAERDRVLRRPALFGLILRELLVGDRRRVTGQTILFGTVDLAVRTFGKFRQGAEAGPVDPHVPSPLIRPDPNHGPIVYVGLPGEADLRREGERVRPPCPPPRQRGSHLGTPGQRVAHPVTHREQGTSADPERAPGACPVRRRHRPHAAGVECSPAILIARWRDAPPRPVAVEVPERRVAHPGHFAEPVPVPPRHADRDGSGRHGAGTLSPPTPPPPWPAARWSPRTPPATASQAAPYQASCWLTVRGREVRAVKRPNAIADHSDDMRPARLSERERVLPHRVLSPMLYAPD